MGIKGEINGGGNCVRRNDFAAWHLLNLRV